MNTNRVVFLCCTLLVCVGICAKTYSDVILSFDYPDVFLLDKTSSAMSETVMVYTGTGDAISRITVQKSMASNNLSDDKLPTRLNAMRSTIIKTLADMTDYQSVTFGKPQKLHLPHTHGVQQSFEETTTDGSILKGKVFIAAEGRYFLQALLLATNENSLDVLNVTLVSLRFGDRALTESASNAESSEADEQDNSSDENDICYIVADEMPEFPGGQQALFTYLSETVKYPAVAVKDKLQGRVICQFVVEKDGSITDVKVVRSSGANSLDQEAVRVIRSMPNWKPGKHRGKTVRVKYTVPVNFKL